ncbi:snRNA-activating protein complex subunit 3 isoform X2 [Copidosoma floridanum]|nr:snRNA-activating protein complex subunit 3 isoform X2 [Copidosoma floridanum]
MEEETADGITSLYERCYKGTAKVNLSSYFEDYKAVLVNSDFDKHCESDSKNFLMNAMANDDIDEEKFAMLEEHCSIDNLTVEGELGKMTKATFEWLKDPTDPTVLEKADHLKTVKCAKQRNQLKSYQVHSKYRSERPVIYEPASVSPGGKTLVPENDILVFIRVYLPFTSRSKLTTGALGKLSVNFVVAMYGSQTLDQLRDFIKCESDYSISVEMSDAPVRFKTANANKVYKSGFFFIEDTFYNDCRDPNNKDNSKVIRDWMSLKKLGSYKIAKMEETRIDSLKMKFGFPWVYQHQGDCEHLICFSDARLVNKSDELNANCYPRIVRIKPRPNRYCMTCGLYNVSWISTSNDRLPHNPCLFCDSCFKSYNYVKGKKVGNFKAYPFPHDNELVQRRTKKKILKKLSSATKPEKDPETIKMEQ